MASEQRSGETAIAARRALQISIAVLALVPVGGGLSGMLFGPGLVDGAPPGTDLDSHFRYLSGLLLAIGLGFWSTIPRIEAQTARARLLTALVVIGGLARLLGLVLYGMPTPTMLGALAMELVVTPLLCLWQAFIARR